jgi:hypothetical protein
VVSVVVLDLAVGEAQRVSMPLMSRVTPSGPTRTRASPASVTRASVKAKPKLALACGACPLRLMSRLDCPTAPAASVTV